MSCAYLTYHLISSYAETPRRSGFSRESKLFAAKAAPTVAAVP